MHLCSGGVTEVCRLELSVSSLEPSLHRSALRLCAVRHLPVRGLSVAREFLGHGGFRLGGSDDRIPSWALLQHLSPTPEQASSKLTQQLSERTELCSTASEQG